MRFWALHVAKASLTALLMAVTMLGAAGIQPPRTAASRVESFRANGVTMLGALLKLGQQEHLSLGIDYLNLDAVEAPVRVSLEHTTVGQILDAIVRQDPGYFWRLKDGIVVVSHEGAPTGPRNLLDYVLPVFSIPRCTLQEANQALWMTLYVRLHPETKGFAGTYSPGRMSTRVGPFYLRASSVRQALDAIVSGAGDAAWVAQVPPDHLQELPPTGLWRLIDFRDPDVLRQADLVRQNLHRSAPATAQQRGRGR